MSEKILSITQLNEYIRSMMDSDLLLSGVSVRGEISNYKCYPSGHHYFTLKDEESSLKCVLFKGNAFRLRFKPENGMKVIAFGRITVYPRDGAYQLYCTSMTVDGLGDLHVAFEQLKKKLEGQRMFDQAHKKPLPAYPNTICIITSPAGAAVHDMLRILNKRYPLIKVKLLPVRVQGQEAPEEIASAIAYANAYNLADLLIVGRGGGSLEDLWAFNTEPVARAIYNSRIPVISAVGHEPDVTISDYVADLRAATPSNAAELAVKDQFSIRQRLDQLEATMAAALQTQLAHGRQKLSILRRSAVLSAPDHWVKQNKKELLTLRTRLLSAAKNGNSIRRNRFISCAAKLDAMSPLKVLSRGYSVVCDTSGKVITSTHQVHKNDEISIRMSDGMVRTIVTQLEDTTNE